MGRKIAHMPILIDETGKFLVGLTDADEFQGRSSKMDILLDDAIRAPF
jgi:hypothetical protein